MMKRVLYFIIGVGFLPLALGGCGTFFVRKPKQNIMPPYIHTLAVRPFSNHTQQYGLEDRLTVAVQTEFNRDGEYPITTESQADGVLSGDITRYVLEPLSYDVNHIPTEYKLWILVDVSFFDKVKNQMLWKEPNMTGQLRFFTASSGLAGSMSEQDAQATIWDELSRDIRTRAIEGFGSVKGASEKVIPDSAPYIQNSRPVDAPPPYPSETPPAQPQTQQGY